MAKNTLRNSLITVGILISFIIISLIYFSPQLEGKKLHASDNLTWRGMAKEAKDFKKETGKQTLWTNSMFGGMPTYFITTDYTGELINKVKDLFLSTVPAPAGIIALGFICFFLMCMLLGVGRWTAVVGSLMWGMASYFFILLASGHDTKVTTLMFAPLVIGGLISAFKNKAFIGSLTMGIGLSLMLSSNHPQMTYYIGLVCMIICINYLVIAIKDKNIKSFAKTCGLLAFALILGIGTNFGRLYSNIEYSKYSTRGKSELKVDESEQTSGLDKSYILDYSYDLGEYMTSFIPRFKGGGMAEALDESSESYQLIESRIGAQQAKGITQRMPMYWGSQPISMAPFYFGAVVFFFFVLGMFIVDKRTKWWIFAVFIFMLLLSLGKNLMFFNSFMLDYFPGYNKFRDVKNVVFAQHLVMVIMTMFTIQALIAKNISRQKITQSILYSFYILGGICLLFIVFPGLAGNFQGPNDANFAANFKQLGANMPQQIMAALADDRRSMLRTDALHSLGLILAAAALSWLYIKEKLKGSIVIAALALLVLVDLWPFDKKYLNNDNFVAARQVENAYTASPADNAILQDKDLDYRVLNIAVNPFADSSTSYFHKSIGGYHGAKMERYQELYTHQMSGEIQRLVSNLQSESTMPFQSLSSLNMMNTRYLIYNPKAAPIKNESALGNAWFVSNIKMVDDANAEIDALKNFNPANEAIVDKRFANLVSDIDASASTNAHIKLTAYQPNKLKYDAQVESGTALAVFSEIYYPKGWNAYIDGKIVEHLRVNYVLRALAIPAGTHKIEFKFEPASFVIGKYITIVCSLILILLAIGAVVMKLKGNYKHE